jgi:hypothetical protein
MRRTAKEIIRIEYGWMRIYFFDCKKRNAHFFHKRVEASWLIFLELDSLLVIQGNFAFDINWLGERFFLDYAETSTTFFEGG